MSGELLGVGVDISDPIRLDGVRSRNDVMQRVMHSSEIELHDLDPLTASRIWAGKEAAAKTLGTGFWEAGVDWDDIRINERFEVSLHGSAAQCAGDSVITLNLDNVQGYVVVTALRFARDLAHPQVVRLVGHQVGLWVCCLMIYIQYMLYI